ncbi:hypothetical protein [Streptomyces sp. NPDC058665]|uniref:hypothetical protein n=1 Tax=Streptomyces sp. NPDC058665 TaxID=3346586 RepID=UPI00364DA016
MSALLEERPPATASARPGLRGPLLVSVRQHRTALLIGAGALVAAVLVLVAYRIWIGSVADDFAATGCALSGPDRPECFPKFRDFDDDMFAFDRALTYGSYVLQFLPGVLGAFVAGPVIARELESGTYKLAWTQSMSPARWLASKLLPLAVPGLLLVALLTVVRAWAASSVPGSTPYPEKPWYELTTYLSLGTAPVAYSLLGIAAGALVGLLVGRTVPAMSVALLVLGGVFLAMNRVRDRLWPTKAATSPLDGYPKTGRTAWTRDNGLLDADGDRLPDMNCEVACQAKRGATARYLDYHPESHFWPIQLVETGIVLALATACVFAAFAVLRRRHG